MSDSTASSSNTTPSSSSSTTQSFWLTQPVTQHNTPNTPALSDGPIIPQNNNLQTNPLPLPPQFQWASIDVQNDNDLFNLHHFITKNYVNESRPLQFSSSYSLAFLRWLLLPPHHNKSLHIAIRLKAKEKLVAFIAGLPFSLHIYNNTLPVALANFLCVHRKFRPSKLAPVLILELVRRANCQVIWQGIYATEIRVTLPFCSTGWFERLLNPQKLKDLHKLQMERITPALATKMCELPKKTETKGFRKMKVPQDVAMVVELLRKKMAKLLVAPAIDEQFVEHFLVPKQGIVESFVVEDPVTCGITDFCSFVIKEMRIKRNDRDLEIKCGFLFYYAAIKTHAFNLIKDLLVMAREEGCDLFRAQGIMGNSGFLERLCFRVTHDEKVMNYYLYNYRLTREVLPDKVGLIIL